MERINQILPRVLDQILKTSKMATDIKTRMPGIRTERHRHSIILPKPYHDKAK